VLSPATRVNDLGVKREHYLAVGVRELWLADPAAKTLTRARPAAEDEHLGSADTLTTELVNGFSLALSLVFSAA
jgi:Uma2 family endonuclease